MRLSRLLWGVAAATIAGLDLDSVDNRDAMSEAQDDLRIERPLSEPESGPSRAATRAHATRNPAACRRAIARPAGRSATSPVAPAAPTRGKGIGRGIRCRTVRHRLRPGVRAANRRPGLVLHSRRRTSRPRPAVSVASPPEKERPRSRGIGGSVLEKGGAPVAGVPVGLKARRVFNGASAASSALRTATTDGRGSFAFGAVADGEYEIHTEKNDRYESASACRACRHGLRRARRRADRRQTRFPSAASWKAPAAGRWKASASR